ncbi:MAG TPA: ATP-binding protein [Rhizomicrobium sp.]|nr:ATP-binding protein [Rhizomicrobium sp.]
MNFRISSLQSRIILFHLLAIVLATVAVPLANYLVINRSTDLFEARFLRSHAEQIARYLKKDDAKQWRLALPPELSAFYGQGLEGLSYAVRDKGGRLVLVSGKDSDAALIPPRQSLTQMSRDGAQVYGVAVNRDGLWVAVAQNAQYPDVIFDDIVADYLSRIGWFTVAILALLLAVDIWIIRRALRPVVQASSIASAIDPKRTDLRLPLKDLPRELVPLIVAVNQALDRLEKGMKLQKEFTADAAHELRTPLAVLRARIDSLPDQKALTALKSDIDVMSHVVSQLLEIAELENAGIAIDGRVDLYAVASEVVAMTAGVAIAQGKEVALTGESAWVRGNAAMIFRAIRNLVDNAIKHTERGSEVIVDVAADGTVRVLDKGPGVPQAERALLVRRFWRARRDQDGAGLGLSIVSRIAELHGARLGISDRDGGGAVFSLSFETA